MTKICFLERSDRVQRRKWRDDRRARRALRALMAEVRPEIVEVAATVGRRGSESVDESLVLSTQVFAWFRDEQAKRSSSGSSRSISGSGWSFLSGDGWSEFGRAQSETLEAAFIGGNSRVVGIPAGHNLLEASRVDLERMLLLDPHLPDYASTACVLPPALPVQRRSRPAVVTRWRYKLHNKAQPLPFDDSDSELLTLAQRAGWQCTVLYDSSRAILVDLVAMQWADSLWACGVDDRDVLCGEIFSDAEPTDLAAAATEKEEFEAAKEEFEVRQRRESRQDDSDLHPITSQLAQMGFDKQLASAALYAFDGDTEEAVANLLGEQGDREQSDSD